MNSLQNLVQWLLIHKRIVVFYFVLSLIIAFAISFISTNAFVLLRVDQGAAGQKITTYASSDAENKVVGASGLIVVPRTTKSLLVSAGDYRKTQTKLELPWYGFTQKTVKVVQDTNADKVAFKSTAGTTCASYSPRIDKLLYYNCRDPKSVLMYNTPPNKTWTSTLITHMFYSNNEAVPYRGGVIGIAHVDATDAKVEGDIAFTTDTGKLLAYNAPDDTDMSTLAKARIFTDKTNTENKNFIIVDANGNIYLGKPSQNNSVDYRKIPAPAKYHSDYNQTFCTLESESVYCYRGKTAAGDIPEDFNLDNVADYSIISTSFSDSGSSTTKLQNGILNFDGVYSSNGALYGKSYKKLFRFDKSGGEYKMNELLQNVDSVAGGKELIVAQNSGVYKYNPSTSDFYQVFYSKNITPKSIYSVDEKIFVIGTTAAGDTTYAYLLNNTPNDSPGKRLIDILPVKSGDLAGASTNDFVGDTLSITLSITVSRLTPRGNRIDAGEVSARKTEALEALENLGVPVDEKNIQFIY
jgi:hypothetical protein